MARKSSRRTNIKYMECWHNHACKIGLHAVDGCGEFAPGGEEGTELAFLCQACGCHRNYHRKELIKKGASIRGSHLYPPLNRPPSSFRDYIRHFMHENRVEVVVDDEESVIDNDGETDVEMRAMKKPKREPF